MSTWSGTNSRQDHPEAADAADAAAQQAAQSREAAAPQPRSQGASKGSGGKRQYRAALPACSRSGFSEPEPWDFDGCKRREPVLDHDRHPPAVVRSVGWRVCMTCSKPFFRDDVIALRMCAGCKAEGPKHR